ncbi:hypothetical protein SOCE26_073370 [Sorangium cellulosum]|uniref:Secreted protein n=1 Tax=Sorangium cellulosum TaxID=56 RepID=A0A2L0F2W1_SORCE|nr:hypothetical protein [Sorangium cellulosum]AUX45841.1 hypothetical protein SOCE26_073370 [Sorangium cellulosum]
MRRGPALACLLLLAAAAPSACGPATYNVRAARAFANEDARRAVIDDRAADLDRAAWLADEVLASTPYSPGDAWVAALDLDEHEGERLRERFEEAPPYNGEHEVSAAKLYRVKLEQALARAQAPRPAPAAFARLFDALAALAAPPGGANGASAASDLPAAWQALAENARALAAEERTVERLAAGRPLGAPDTPELAAARARASARRQALAGAQRDVARAAAALRVASAADEPSRTIARDTLRAVSFLLRMHIESLAVAPYVVKQARRVARDDPGYGPAVARAEALSRLLEEQRQALAACAEALTTPARTPLDETAGFEMREGLLEQSAAIHLDAIHLRLNGDADLLFFHQLASPSSSGGINDYRGRTRRLAYDTDPVFMLGARALVTYDFEHVRNAARLNAGFKTNRLFSSGGDIQYDDSLGKLLGLNGLASDVFDLGADLLGFSTSVKISRFTSGRVTEIAVDPVTGRDTGAVASAPFQLLVRQIDVGFDVTKLFPDAADDLYLEELLAGFRAMDYKLPRIFYALRERDPGSGDVYVFERQSPAQSVRSQLYQGGFSLRMGNGEWPRLAPFGDLGLYAGAGPVRYSFSGDPAAPGGANDVDEATMIALSGNLSIGLRLRLTSSLSRLRLLTELSYNVEAVGQGIVSSIQATRRGDETTYTVGRKIDLGGFDLFHGPRLLAVLVL